MDPSPTDSSNRAHFDFQGSFRYLNDQSSHSSHVPRRIQNRKLELESMAGRGRLAEEVGKLMGEGV